MQLTMTLTKGVNDREVGWVVDVGMAHSHVKLVALQPVTYSGRYDLKQDPIDRLTLSDVVKAVVSQARWRMREGDFVPIPCSHPNCGWLTLFARRFGLTANVIRHIDLARANERAAYKTVLSTGEFRRLLAGEGLSLRAIAGAIGRRLVRRAGHVWDRGEAVYGSVQLRFGPCVGVLSSLAGHEGAAGVVLRVQRAGEAGGFVGGVSGVERGMRTRRGGKGFRSLKRTLDELRARPEGEEGAETGVAEEEA